MLQETEKHRINIVKWTVIQFCLGSPGQCQCKKKMSLKAKKQALYLIQISWAKAILGIQMNITGTTPFPKRVAEN